MVYIAVTF